MLDAKEIKHYIDEFKKTNFDDIVNRNTHLSIDEINSLVFDLNKEVDIYDEIIIEKEFYSLLELINLDDTKELEFGLDIDVAQKFKKHIIQIKINALNEVKKKIQNKVDITTTKVISEDSIPDTFVTIEDAFEEYLKTRDGISDKHKGSSERDVKHFIKFCNTNEIEYTQNLQNKNLIDYRIYLREIKPKATIGTLNNALKNVIAFLNYIPDITFKPTIREKINSKRSPYKNEKYKKILENIDLIKYTQKKNVLNKYHKEYEIIIKIAAYIGARENEICQLTKKIF